MYKYVVSSRVKWERPIAVTSYESCGLKSQETRLSFVKCSSWGPKSQETGLFCQQLVKSNNTEIITSLALCEVNHSEKIIIILFRETKYPHYCCDMTSSQAFQSIAVLNSFDSCTGIRSMTFIDDVLIQKQNNFVWLQLAKVEYNHAVIISSEIPWERYLWPVVVRAS